MFYRRRGRDLLKSYKEQASIDQNVDGYIDMNDFF